MEKKLYRSQTDKVFSGLCGGLARYANLSPGLVRLLTFLSICFGSLGFWVYIVLAIVIPKEPQPGYMDSCGLYGNDAMMNPNMPGAGAYGATRMGMYQNGMGGYPQQGMYQNGMGVYPNAGMNGYQNGMNGYPNGMNGYPNGMGGYPQQGMYGYPNGMAGYPNAGMNGYPNAAMNPGYGDPTYGTAGAVVGYGDPYGIPPMAPMPAMMPEAEAMTMPPTEPLTMPPAEAVTVPPMQSEPEDLLPAEEVPEITPEERPIPEPTQYYL